MDLVNETTLPAALLATVIEGDRMAASVVVRVTYGLERGRLVIADEQPWLVSGAPQETPHGNIEAETPFVKGGVDLFVFGHARASKGAPVSRMEVAVSVGDFVRRANVFGERIWLRRATGRLEASRAGVFTEVPLTVASAFGGTTSWDDLAMPYMDNPAGKGFCVQEDDADGAPLPNLEEPDSPMTSWDAQPAVCGFGFCPTASAARFRNGWELSEDQKEILAVRPASLNTAYPKMIAPRVRPGDVMRLDGVRHDGPLTFAIPEPPAAVRLRFGANLATRVPSVDQVGVLVDEGRVFVSYRFPFRYTVRPREKRGVTLMAHPASPS